MIRLTREAIRAIREGHTHTCGYVYRDGILIRADKVVRHGKQRVTIERWFAHPGETKLWAGRYRESGMQDPVPIRRVVCHDSSVLLDGLTSMEVSYNNGSETSRKMNLQCTTTTIVTASGARHYSTAIDGVMSDSYSPQGETDTVYGGKVATFSEILESLRKSENVLVILPPEIEKPTA